MIRMRYVLNLIFVTMLVLPWNSSVVFSATVSDDELLTLIQKKSFNFFWNEGNPNNGLLPDKAFNFKAGADPVASIASVGFALTAYPIGVEHQWITRNQAYDRTLKTLKFFRDHVEREHGFFYHFVDMETGKRAWNSEVSSIDTALFLAGALFSGSYFKGTEVEKLANQIYDRVDFPWMLNRGKTLSMGWKPEGRFLKPRWNEYNEHMILYFLAIGSPANPISADSWKAIKRKVMAYGSYVLIACPPLFTHQYSQCWIDFRGITDGNANYFKNSVMATLANRAFCLDQRNKYETYSENVWGLTASDGPSGYKAYGAEPGGAVHDGTIAPTAAISSIVFTPELSINVARELYEKHRQMLWGRYGFTDSFNFDLNWKSPYVLGIDVGPMLIMIENYRTGFVWRQFMKLAPIQKALREIGFHPGDEALKVAKMPMTRAYRLKTAIKIDGNRGDWKEIPVTYLDSSRFIDYGEVDSSKDLSADFAFQWDENNLYFYCRVRDDQLVFFRNHGEIHRDDLVELFIDASGDGFRWNNKKDYQFGFSQERGSAVIRAWLWPHGYDPVRKGEVKASIRRLPDGYVLEALIPWKMVGIHPKPGMEVHLTPAIHDIDQNGSEGKITWCFNKKDGNTFELGKVVLQ